MRRNSLARAGAVPLFAVTALDGRTMRYADLWQRRTLLLLSVAEPAHPALLDQLRSRPGHDAELVVLARIA